MTITAEQLDELERRAREALEAETAYDVDPTQLTESRLILAHEKMLLAAGDGATPAMPGATILQLVAIARAALAWSEADDARRELAKRARTDMSIMAEFMLMDDDESHPSDRAVYDALRALYVATRGTP